MKRLILTTALLALAAPAYASQCPQEMAAIDTALETASLSEAELQEVQSLRQQGEEEHNAGDHAASMETLGEAKAILNIE